jgi:hypothetical protein
MQSIPSRDEIFLWSADYRNIETQLPILPNLYRVLFALGAQSDIFPKRQYH